MNYLKLLVASEVALMSDILCISEVAPAWRIEAKRRRSARSNAKIREFLGTKFIGRKGKHDPGCSNYLS